MYRVTRKVTPRLQRNLQMNNFKLGDRVRLISFTRTDENEDYLLLGMTGVIHSLRTDAEYAPLLIHFDNNMAGHSANGIPEGHAWWAHPDDFEYEVIKTKDQRIIDKIKQLDEKFKHRKSKNVNNLSVQT